MASGWLAASSSCNCTACPSLRFSCSSQRPCLTAARGFVLVGSSQPIRSVIRPQHKQSTRRTGNWSRTRGRAGHGHAPASLTVNSLFPQIPRRIKNCPWRRQPAAHDHDQHAVVGAAQPSVARPTAGRHSNGTWIPGQMGRTSTAMIWPQKRNGAACKGLPRSFSLPLVPYWDHGSPKCRYRLFWGKTLRINELYGADGETRTLTPCGART